MRKIILILMISFRLFAAAPVSSRIGPISVVLPPDSVSRIALEALGSEYTNEWLDKYAYDRDAFALAFTDELSAILPLKSMIIGTEKSGALDVISGSTGDVISLSFNDGKIVSVSVTPSKENGSYEEDSQND